MPYRDTSPNTLPLLKSLKLSFSSHQKPERMSYERLDEQVTKKIKTSEVELNMVGCDHNEKLSSSPFPFFLAWRDRDAHQGFLEVSQRAGSILGRLAVVLPWFRTGAGFVWARLEVDGLTPLNTE